ncbi:MAG: haloalkane dehalogenase [Promethearchaeota archaeon]
MIEFIRTPDERFENLPGYNFSPHYIEIEGLRIHYVDEGDVNTKPVLLLHGEPTWGYLYRKMIPPIAKAGHRVIAPDLMGFGRSDKPIHQEDYTYKKHVDMMTQFVEELDLNGITLFCQDWGCMVGLMVVANVPDRFDRIIVSNGNLPYFKGDAKQAQQMFNKWVSEAEPEVWDPAGGDVFVGGIGPNASFIKWVAYALKAPELPIGDGIQKQTFITLSDEEIAAYDAPFPDERYKAGARIFPYLSITHLEANTKAWKEVFHVWEKPFLTAYAEHALVTRDGEKIFQKYVPGAKNQPHVTIKDANHFIQDDKGEELAQLTIDFIARTSK